MHTPLGERARLFTAESKRVPIKAKTNRFAKSFIYQSVKV